MGKAKVLFALIVMLVSFALSLDALAESDVDEWAGYMPGR